MPAWNELVIDSEALCANLRAIQGAAVMPMVKGNGYGVGILPLARLCADLAVPYIGVSHLSEGIFLRQQGIVLPILVLCFLPEEAQEIVAYRLTPVVDTAEKVTALAAVAPPAYPLHLKLNTGLNRFGASLEEFSLLAQKIREKTALQIEGVMTHLMGSSDPTFDSLTQKQLSLFEHSLSCLPEKPQWIHAGASSGHDRFPQSFCNLARIGLFLFQPHPVLTLRTRVVTLRNVAAGESISYLGAPLTSPKRIAVLGMGYHDGWHPSYGPHTLLHFEGGKAPLIGQICMDFMMADVTHLPPIRLGEWGELFNPQHPLKEVSTAIGVNPRMLLSALGPRIERRWQSHNFI